MAGFSPTISGPTKWAKTATQDVTDPDHVELKTPCAPKCSTEDQVARDLVAAATA